jgi:aminopeptidase N
MAHPVRPDEVIEINNFYTATVYEKGAEVVRMVHTLIGEEAFRAGLRLYLERHDGQAVTCDDFRLAMADASGKNLTQFARWYSQAGTPVLDVTGAHDAAARTYTLRVTQSTPPTPGQSHKLPLHVPFAVALLDRDGTPLPLRLRGEPEPRGRSRVLELTEASHTFTFVDVARPPVPSLLRGFSAPVHLQTTRSREDLAFLLAHDDDSFSRWDAGQRLAQEVIVQLVSERARSPSPATAVLVEACRALLRQALAADGGLDRALVAEAMTFPGETMIGDVMPVVDPDAIHDARELVRRTVAGALRAELTSLHARLVEEEPAEYRVEAAHVARRTLKHVCLSFLLALDEPAVWELAEKQFRTAGNMTDRMSALLNLAHSSAPGRGAALAAFYDRFAHEPLVVDKWLRAQATAPHGDVLERVRELTQHPAFSLTNPNKVRALVGGFAANQVGYHRADGGGYAFLADHVLALDKVNPQIAARLCAAGFSRWRRFDARRQPLLRAQLERIARAEGLSRDVYEIATKTMQ